MNCAEKCRWLKGTGLKRKARSEVKRNEDLQRKAGTAAATGTAAHCPSVLYYSSVLQVT
jgi:hypothetical protein